MKRVAFSLVFLLLFVLVLSVAAQSETYTVNVGSARVRAEPNTNATVIATLRLGTTITVLEAVTGDSVNNSTTWLRVEIRGKTGYIHASLVRKPAAGTSVNSVQPSSPASPLISTPVPNPPLSGAVGCPSRSATCSQLTCEQAYACLAAGVTKLDRDRDGKPCEAQCGG